MLQLHYGCYASKFSVHPKNWKQIGASTKKDWYIHYRFHDPALKHDKRYRFGYLVIFRGMNEEKSLTERRALIPYLIDAEIKNLMEGYHPILKIFKKLPNYNYDINPDTPFIEALRKGLEKIKAVKGTLIDMKSIVDGTEKSARQLGINHMPVKDVTRKYFKRIFEQCYVNNKRFSPSRHNKYRAYLMKIYKELIQLEAVEVNPLRDIVKEKEIKKQRILLTAEERKLIDETLFKKQYYFWRMIQIFFHSGARETELMKLQVKHVDLERKRVNYTVLKGSNREVYRPIKDIVLPLWQEIINECNPNDYLFSTNLRPGPKQIRADQLNRRWNLHVRKKLDIKAGLYSLKHLNTTEVVDLLNEEDAARLNAHTSTAMVRSIYDVNREERQNKRIQGLNNKFAG